MATAAAASVLAAEVDAEEGAVFEEAVLVLEEIDNALHAFLSTSSSSSGSNDKDNIKEDEEAFTLSDALVLFKSSRSKAEAEAAEGCVRLMLASQTKLSHRQALAQGTALEKKRAYPKAMQRYEDILLLLMDQEEQGDQDEEGGLEAEVRARIAGLSYLTGHLVTGRSNALEALRLEPRHVGALGGLALCEEALLLGGSGGGGGGGVRGREKESSSDNELAPVEAAVRALEGAVEALPWASDAYMWPRLNKVRGVAESLRRAAAPPSSSSSPFSEASSVVAGAAEEPQNEAAEGEQPDLTTTQDESAAQFLK